MSYDRNREAIANNTHITWGPLVLRYLIAYTILGAVAAAIILGVWGDDIPRFLRKIIHALSGNHRWGWNYLDGLVIAVFFSVVLTSWKIFRLKRFTATAIDQIAEAVTHAFEAGYFYLGPTNNLFLSRDGKKLAVATISGKRKPKLDWEEIDVAKVKSARAHSPDRPQDVVVSGDDRGSDAAQFNRAYHEARVAQFMAERTGLYIDIDDIHNQETFVRMPHQDAKRWVAVFEKLKEGTLEQPALERFPRK